MDDKLLLALFMSPLLFALAARALGSNGIVRTKTDITIHVDWPMRFVFSYLALGVLWLFDPLRDWAGALLMSLVCAPILLIVWVTKIRISEQGIFSRTPWRRSKFVAWNEIVTVGSVSNGGGWSWQYIDTTNKGKIRWDGLIDEEGYIPWALDRFAPHAIRKTSKYLER